MASSESHEVNVTVINELGMHARAATQFVQLAAKFPCQVTVVKDGQAVNGKSIMGVLMLVAAKGARLTIRAEGADAEAAVAALVELVKDRFGEDR